MLTTNRRDFLKSSMVACGLTVPSFLSKTANALQVAGTPGARDTILVVVQLTGGNDGLNTVIPFTDEEYPRLRPTLRIARDQVRRLNDTLGLHPAMEGMAGLLQDNALCVVQGVGYPNPSQSHFRSMDIWQAASTADTLNEGWLGKALRSMNAPAFHIAAGNESAPLAYSGAPVRVPSITSLDDFQLRTAGAGDADTRRQREIITGLAQPGGTGTPNPANLLDFVQRTAQNTYQSSQRLQEIGRNYTPRVPYPQTGLANRLRLVAQLINAELGARLFYVSIDGFDTHANQAASHGNLLGEVSGAITAFYRDLAARGHANRLLIMTFSEFGRRARENGSRGTDHGSGAPMFLVGGRVRAGVIGEHPSLTQLDAGNLRHHTDFRQVYAAILDQWLGVPSREVLGQAYEPVSILARR